MFTTERNPLVYQLRLSRETEKVGYKQIAICFKELVWRALWELASLKSVGRTGWMEMQVRADGVLGLKSRGQTNRLEMQAEFLY